MLLRFGVENHRSIKNKQELSLVASSLEDVSTGLIDCPAVASGRLLPATVIYGANASGKSNLVSALRWMRSAVLLSHSRGEPGGSLPLSPFLLDPESATKPSIFDIDFVLEGVRYHYGFEASEEAFIAEWLFAYPNERRQALFERDQMNFVFGRNLKGQNKVISGLTRSNSLFLSAAAQNGHEHLSAISAFFRTLQLTAASTDYSDLQDLGKQDIDHRVIDFLSKIGTGVIGYRREERKTPEKMEGLRRDLDLLLKKYIGESIDLTSSDSEMQFDVRLAHRGTGEGSVYLNLRWESDGTKRLLVLLKRVFQALDQGSVLVCDELDASLHTQACEALLALFSMPATNPTGAQLIATTHDTNLLRSSILRRDQVWFAEKDAEGATHLYPLTDIRTRKGDNIERGYLQGRYGAIPFSGSLAYFSRMINGSTNAEFKTSLRDTRA